MSLKTFSVNADNDIFIGTSGNISIAKDLQAIMNICAHVAKSISKEMLYNQDRGLPDFENVWSGMPNLKIWENALRKAILRVDGVTLIASLDLERSENILSYFAVIKTIYGTGQINEQI